MLITNVYYSWLDLICTFVLSSIFALCLKSTGINATKKGAISTFQDDRTQIGLKEILTNTIFVYIACNDIWNVIGILIFSLKIPSMSSITMTNVPLVTHPIVQQHVHVNYKEKNNIWRMSGEQIHNIMKYGVIFSDSRSIITVPRYV